MKKFQRIISISLIFILTFALIITQTGCKNDKPIATDTNYYLLDTVCQIDIYEYNIETAQKTIQSNETDEKKLGNEIIAKAFQNCTEYEKVLSKTKEGSDIYKINHASGQPVSVTKATVDNLKAGIKYGKLSQGKFDITIGAASELWDFQSSTRQIPDDNALKEAVKTVGYEQIKIDENSDGSGTVSLSNPKTQIDLGGIAKGYIADRTTDFLEKCGVTSAVVNLGGNIETIGTKPSGDNFDIGIERPYTERSEVIGSVPVNNKTLVTSGIYERCFQLNGKTYHHILNTKTGYPADTDVELVTIVADKGKSVDADGLSTTCLTMGVEQAKKMIEDMDGIDAVFVDKNDEITCTSGVQLEK